MKCLYKIKRGVSGAAARTGRGKEKKDSEIAYSNR